MNRKLRQALCAGLAAVIMGSTAVTASAASAADFTDVPANAWYYKAVDYAASVNLFAGMGEGKFGPNLPMTRAMFVTVLGRKAGVNKGEFTSSNFTDVPINSWYGPYVEWAAQNKIVSGIGDGKFNPNGSITREQMAKILYGYAKRTGCGEIQNGTEILKFPDTGDVADWAKEPMTWAVDKKIINGSDGKLKPRDTATRAQVAQVFFKAKDVLTGTELTEPPEEKPEELPEMEIFSSTWSEDQNPYDILRRILAGSSATWDSSLNTGNSYKSIIIHFADWGSTHETAEWASFNALELLNNTGADRFCIREEMTSGKPSQTLTMYYAIPAQSESKLMAEVQNLIEAEFPNAIFTPDTINTGHGWRGEMLADDEKTLAENAQRIASAEIRYLTEWYSTGESFNYWISEPEPGKFYFFY